MDLVEEEDRPGSGRAEPLPGAGQDLAYVLHRGRHGRQLLEVGAGRGRDNPRERRLPAPGRPVEDRRMDAVLLDRAAQGRPLAEHVLLAHELAEGRRPQALREWRDVAGACVGCVGEEVTHGVSMLSRVTGSDADAWSGASYERIAETFAPIHDRIVEALAIAPGDRVLDVACGTGGVALRAARTGADVAGTDISADQLAKARRAAAAEGLEIQLDEGDCQQLPYADASFDAVVSAFGAVFAADHARTAAELARVCRPGG